MMWKRGGFDPFLEKNVNGGKGKKKMLGEKVLALEISAKKRQ